MDGLLILAIFLGFVAAAFLVFRDPAFWAGFGIAVFKKLLPFIMKRMPADEEKEWRDIMLRGGDKDELRKFEEERRRRKRNAGLQK